MTKLVLNAEIREGSGKSDSRRLRRLADKVPGIIYGAGKEPDKVTFSGKELRKILEEETFFSHIIDIKKDEGKAERVILRDLQRHPIKGNVIHLDFMRISKSRQVSVHIPLHFLNEDKCFGVKNQKGTMSKAMTEIKIVCLPDQMPDFIAVDLIDLKIRESLHLSDLKLEGDFELVAFRQKNYHDLPVVSIQPPRGGEDDDEDEELAAEAEPSEESVEAES